jgi:hypothetical protein
MNQNPNTNKECEVCEDYGGNPPPHVCSTPSPKDWETRFDEEFNSLYGINVSVLDSEPVMIGNPPVADIKDFIRNEKAKSYEEVFIEGQKHAFGVDKENVRKEAQKELAKEIQEKLFEDYMRHGYIAKEIIIDLLRSKHLLD